MSSLVEVGSRSGDANDFSSTQYTDLTKAAHASLLALSALLLLGTAANASTLLTNPVGYAGLLLDIGIYGDKPFDFTTGPLSLPQGITYSSDSTSSVIGRADYSVVGNGYSTENLIGANTQTAIVTLSFATPVSSFAGYFNYAPEYNDPVITALGSMGQVLATYDLALLAPISTPAGKNQYAFRGVADATADIAAFQFSGAYIFLHATASVSSVPLPSGLPLFGAALLSLAVVGCGKQRKVDRAI